MNHIINKNIKEKTKMTIEELAAELGKKIKEDPRIEAMNKARDEYETNEQLHAYMNEYSAQQEAIQAEAAKDTPDSLLIAKMQGRVDELYKLIINNEIFARLNEAQEAVNELMENVNNIITFNITGELPSCTHDCSSCGGGCSH